jgi:hypothetical protein
MLYVNCYGSRLPRVRLTACFRLAHNENIAGQRLDEFAQLLGPSLVGGRFEHQYPAIELDDPLP